MVVMKENELFWMNNKTIIGLGFCMITRIMQNSEGDIHLSQWALFTRQHIVPRDWKKLCFNTLNLAVKNLGARLDR